MQVIVLAGCLYLLVACLLYWPVAPWDSSRVLFSANSDPAQSVWFLEWTAWAVGHLHNPLFSNYVDVPTGANIANDTSVPLLGALGAPITWLFGSITTDNLLMRIGLAGSAFTMFLVLRRWVRWWPAAVIGGGLFGFNSILLQNSQDHLHIVFLVVVPLILWSVDELFVTQRRSPIAMGAVLALLAIAQWFINDEVLFACGMFSVIGLAILALAHRDRAAEHLRRALPGAALALGIFVVVIAYPAWFMVAGPQHLKGPTQPAWVIASYHSDLFGPIDPTVTITTRAPAAIAARQPSMAVLHSTGAQAYLGLPLALGLIAVAVAWWRNGVVRFATAMAGIAFLLSLGGRLYVLGHDTGIPLPAAVFAHLPLLYEVLPSRLTIFMFLFLAILLGVGLDLTARRIIQLVKERPATGETRRRSQWGRLLGIGRGRRRRVRPVTAAALVVAVVAATFVPTFVAGATRVETPVLYGGAAPMVARYTPPGGVVLYMPLIRSFAAQPMIWQAQSNMAYRMVGGYVILPRSSYSSRNWPKPSKELATVLAVIPTVRPPGPIPAHPTQDQVIAACRALPTALAQYDVDSVVIWAAPLTDTRYGIEAVTGALGPAPHRDGGLVMWDRARQRERGPGACDSLGTP